MIRLLSKFISKFKSYEIILNTNKIRKNKKKKRKKLLIIYKMQKFIIYLKSLCGVTGKHIDLIVLKYGLFKI